MHRFSWQQGVGWKFTSKKIFTTKSVYEWLERDLARPNYKWVWKAKIPLKIKTFIWQLFQNAVLTKDNMRKRSWPGNPSCSFCRDIETVGHLIFGCTFARSVWGTLIWPWGHLVAPDPFGRVGRGCISSCLTGGSITWKP